MFEYIHRVQFYETDMMGIVHHGNYLRFCEEARVAWAMQNKLLYWDKPEGASAFAVVKTEVSHLAPCRFGDALRIEVQAKLVRVRIVFEYKLWKEETKVAECRTWHVSLDQNLRPERPAPQTVSIMGNMAWNETWLSSL